MICHLASFRIHTRRNFRLNVPCGPSNVPVQVSNLGSRAVAISAMGSSACALLENPTDVQCWGFNAYGQLGDGSTTDSNVPVSVQGL